LLLRSRHLTLRSHSAPRRGQGWRVILALGAIVAVFIGGIKLVPHIHFGTQIPQTTLLIQDDYDGVPVPGAHVLLMALTCPGGVCKPAEMTSQGPVAHQFDANIQGRVQVRLPGERVAVSISQQGYDARQTEMSWPPPSTPVPLTLRPTWLTGRVTLLGKPLVNAKVLVAPTPTSEPTVTTTTDSDGKYRFTDIPEGASLLVDAPSVSRRPRVIGRHSTFDIALRPDVLTGTVRDPVGQPVSGLTVTSGSLAAQTKSDGSFTLSGVDDGATLIVKGVGYLPQEIALGASLTQETTVRPFVAKGIYVQSALAAKPAALDKLIAQLSASDMNTMVIDLKDNNGLVYYDTKVALAHEVGAVQPILDVPRVLKTLHDQGIYAIARIVVMEDPIAGSKRPDLAIRDTRTGKPWRNNNGQTWLNPTEPKVWQYVSDLAGEAASLGFDEVQFDYVRFPTDGNLDTADFGPNFKGGEAARRDAIKGLLGKAHTQLLPTKTLLGADVFGITGWIRNDNGIGQQFEDLVALLDVICPMDYPSHYGKGFNGWDYPNNFPYEVIERSISVREARVAEVHRKTRPWLQAFTYGPGRAYGTAEVLAQIQACNEMQTSGYLLWNAGSDYPQNWLPPKPPVATKPTA